MFLLHSQSNRCRRSNFKTDQIAYNMVMSWGWVGNTLTDGWGWVGQVLPPGGDELVKPSWPLGLSWSTRVWTGLELVLGMSWYGGWVDCHSYIAYPAGTTLHDGCTTTSEFSQVEVVFAAWSDVSQRHRQVVLRRCHDVATTLPNGLHDVVSTSAQRYNDVVTTS